MICNSRKTHGSPLAASASSTRTQNLASSCRGKGSFCFPPGLRIDDPQAVTPYATYRILKPRVETSNHET